MVLKDLTNIGVILKFCEEKKKMVVKKEGQKKKVFVDLQNLVWFEDLQKKERKMKGRSGC